MDMIVYARENETGWAGKNGILVDSANGHENELTPRELLEAIQWWQDQDHHITEDEYNNDESGKIHKFTLSDCENYLMNFK